MGKLELWGGHECTVSRVGDTYADQTIRSGHEFRPDDLDRFASLGLTALRYPALWERIAPRRPDELDFSWLDPRLKRMADLGISPILGLLHHGSGPAYTSLLDPEFPSKFRNYAAKVAARYPGVRDWTPINEPLTTARFSCLYGHWYPHAQSEGLCWEALLNQIDATRLAMKEIRQVNSQARLVQTEDLGRTYATPALSAQARFENDRRWLTWDLLAGRVVSGHALHGRLAAMGFGDRLARIAADPCPADVVGVNHYVTSERFLDERLAPYPPERWGGNDETPYADVEAVRVLSPAPFGLEGVLREAAQRYNRPIAVTECHLGCTREEQLRWAADAWRTAQALRAGGVDITAVTAWALLGAYDWNSLLTRAEGHYEVGAFDLRGAAPRPTALAETWRALAAGRALHASASSPGWWRRPERLTYPPQPGAPASSRIPGPRPKARLNDRPLLIMGAGGALGSGLVCASRRRGLHSVPVTRRALDLSNGPAIAAFLDEADPWAVINAAGWAGLEAAETDPAGCFAANVDAAINLAEACAERGVPFTGFSSDMVFDGRGDRALREDDLCAPLNVLGRSQASAETRIAALGAKTMIVRTAALFSARPCGSLPAELMAYARPGGALPVANDLVCSPTYLPDLAEAVLDLVIDGEIGVWHLVNEGGVTWADFAVSLAHAFGIDPSPFQAAPWRTLGGRAERPVHAPLSSRRGLLLPPLGDALHRLERARA